MLEDMDTKSANGEAHARGSCWGDAHAVSLALNKEVLRFRGHGLVTRRWPSWSKAHGLDPCPKGRGFESYYCQVLATRPCCNGGG
jgi:hypothetical protein